MKRFIILLLSLILVLIVGLVLQDLVFNLYHRAEATLEGISLPSLTRWVYHFFAESQTLSILCVLLVPWVLFAAHAVTRLSKVCPPGDFLLSFLIFALVEILLALLFLLSALLPLVPYYPILAGSASWTAFVAHIILSIVVCIAGAMVFSELRRRKR